MYRNDNFITRALKGCLIITLFLPSISPINGSQRPGKRRPGTPSSRARQVPVPKERIAPTETMAESPPSQPAFEEKKDEKPMEVEQNKVETNESKTPPAEKKREMPAPQSGYLNTMYTVIAPIILGTMDKALGLGIAQGTKSAIKDSLERRDLINTIEDIESRAPALVVANDQELKRERKMILSSEDYLKNPIKYKSDLWNIDKYFKKTPEQRKDLVVQSLLKEKKIDDIDEVEKATSLSYITARAASTVLITTLVQFFSYGTIMLSRVLLQSLLPTENSQ
jgi:hypothetical protein